MSKRIILTFLSLTIISLGVFAQELNCKVTVNAKKLANADKIKIFKTFETTLSEFMNNTKWTDDTYDNNEKINCAIFIAIDADKSINDKLGDDQYSATVSIQSSRPVYDSDYESTLLNFIDKNFIFTYREFDAIEYSENTFLSNTSSIFSFYSYIILGLDYDSFSPNGGTKYFNKAESIVNISSSQDGGWVDNPKKRRNRFALTKELLNSRYQDYRSVMYAYHLNGCDLLSTKTDEGRANMLAGLTKLEKMYSENLESFLVQIFVEAKSDEIINVFGGAPKAEKDKVFRIISKIDPTNTTKYQKGLYSRK